MRPKRPRAAAAAAAAAAPPAANSDSSSPGSPAPQAFNLQGASTRSRRRREAATGNTDYLYQPVHETPSSSKSKVPIRKGQTKRRKPTRKVSRCKRPKVNPNSEVVPFTLPSPDKNGNRGRRLGRYGSELRRKRAIVAAFRVLESSRVWLNAAAGVKPDVIPREVILIPSKSRKQAKGRPLGSFKNEDTRKRAVEKALRKLRAANIPEADIQAAWLGYTSHVLPPEGRESDSEDDDVDQGSHSSDRIDTVEAVEEAEEVTGEAHALDDGAGDDSEEDEKDNDSDDSEYVVNDDADDDDDGRNGGSAGGTLGGAYSGAHDETHGDTRRGGHGGGHVDGHVDGHVGGHVGDRGGTQGTAHDTPGSGTGNYLRLDGTSEAPDRLLALPVEDEVEVELQGGVSVVCASRQRSIVFPAVHVEDSRRSLPLRSRVVFSSPCASDLYPSGATETSRDTMGIFGTDPTHSLEAALDEQRCYSGSGLPLRFSSLQEGSDSRRTSKGRYPDLEVAPSHAEFDCNSTADNTSKSEDRPGAFSEQIKGAQDISGSVTVLRADVAPAAGPLDIMSGKTDGSDSHGTPSAHWTGNVIAVPGTRAASSVVTSADNPRMCNPNTIANLIEVDSGQVDNTARAKPSIPQSLLEQPNVVHYRGEGGNVMMHQGGSCDQVVRPATTDSLDRARVTDSLTEQRSQVQKSVVATAEDPSGVIHSTGAEQFGKQAGNVGEKNVLSGEVEHEEALQGLSRCNAFTLPNGGISILGQCTRDDHAETDGLHSVLSNGQATKVIGTNYSSRHQENAPKMAHSSEASPKVLGGGAKAYQIGMVRLGPNPVVPPSERFNGYLGDKRGKMDNLMNECMHRSSKSLPALSHVTAPNGYEDNDENRSDSLFESSFQATSDYSSMGSIRRDPTIGATARQKGEYFVAVVERMAVRYQGIDEQSRGVMDAIAAIQNRGDDQNKRRNANLYVAYSLSRVVQFVLDLIGVEIVDGKLKFCSNRVLVGTLYGVECVRTAWMGSLDDIAKEHHRSDVIWNRTFLTPIHDELPSCVVVEKALSLIGIEMIQFDVCAHRYDDEDKCFVDISMNTVHEAYASALEAADLPEVKSLFSR